MILSVSGEYDIILERGALAKAEEYSALDERCIPVGKVIKPSFDEPESIVTSRITQHMDVARPIITYGYKDNNIGFEAGELLRRRLCVDMALELFAGSESEFFNDAYDKQIIDNSFEYGYTAETDYAYATFTVETDHYEEFLSEVKQYICRTKKEGFDTQTFERTKKTYLGDIIRIFNSVNGIAIQSTYHTFAGTDLFDYYDALNSITLQDVTDAFASLFSEERCAVSLILPKEE